MKIEKEGYVVYTKVESPSKVQKVLIFVHEFKDVELAEAFKADGNREFNLKLLVGISYHHLHDTDHEKDMLIIKPKNGDEEFHYSEMVTFDSLLEQGHISKIGFDKACSALKAVGKSVMT